MGVIRRAWGNVGTLILDRPERAHAYDRALLEELDQAFTALATECTVVILASTGDRAFCGGADLKEMRRVEPLSALDLLSQQVFDRIARSRAVTIAAVQGPAVGGGCELALACDFRIVGPRATFSLPETSFGLIPAAGGCTRLSRLIGAGRARAVILAGATITAREAVHCGLAMQLDDDVWAAACQLSLRIAERDPVALWLAKQALELDGVDASSRAFERVAEALLYYRRRPLG